MLEHVGVPVASPVVDQEATATEPAAEPAAATPDRVRAAYSPEDWERLVELKNRYDPENLFRMNQNIRPTTQEMGRP
jgi:FAD/FMN-containing dehydrogenase